MSIEKTASGATIITGDSVYLYRVLALQAALRLECKGMTRRGRSAYKIVKSEFGLTGSKQKVLAQFEKLIQENYPVPVAGPVCWKCKRPQDKHVEADYDAAGCCSYRDERNTSS